MRSWCVSWHVCAFLSVAEPAVVLAADKVPSIRPF